MTNACKIESETSSECWSRPSVLFGVLWADSMCVLGLFGVAMVLQSGREELGGASDFAPGQSRGSGVAQKQRATETRNGAKDRW